MSNPVSSRDLLFFENNRPIERARWPITSQDKRVDVGDCVAVVRNRRLRRRVRDERNRPPPPCGRCISAERPRCGRGPPSNAYGAARDRPPVAALAQGEGVSPRGNGVSLTMPNYPLRWLEVTKSGHSSTRLPARVLQSWNSAAENLPNERLGEWYQNNAVDFHRSVESSQ